MWSFSSQLHSFSSLLLHKRASVCWIVLQFMMNLDLSMTLRFFAGKEFTFIGQLGLPFHFFYSALAFHFLAHCGWFWIGKDCKIKSSNHTSFSSIRACFRIDHIGNLQIFFERWLSLESTFSFHEKKHSSNSQLDLHSWFASFDYKYS